ncbi:SulP family inorganic anion transporter [Planctomycetes bacterium TBK1r]|uniref:Bicarbonate transporter BicA n=2 Tax=Stieleria TaxID=2795973 RepID=A0ABX5XTI9_9BACT|nr:Bicarbonate transporter BicA [Planctomycetes bacterium TBK1r]
MHQSFQRAYWSSLIQSPKQDFLASIVVFLVALPLCMGIAIASGVPVAAGLITGIVGGLVVGWFAGAPLQVSGPAAGLTVIVFELVREHGIAALGVAVLIGGSLQLVAGMMRLGQWFRAVSPAVIYGMLAGVGVLILASQFHVMLDDAPKSNGLSNLVSIPSAAYSAVLSHDQAAALGTLAIVILLAWNKLAKGRLRLVPAPLVAIVSASVFAACWQPDVQFVQMPVSLMSELHFASPQVFQTTPWQAVLQAGVVIGIVASAETLLCASAVEKMKPDVRTDYDRELVAQGIGNMICGLLGSLPMTGVIVRSSANVESGGQSRLSAILHGAWLLAFVVVLASVVEFIPTAALAAILVYTGIKLVNLKAIKQLKSHGYSEVGVYLATLGTIVATDLLTGVVVGVVLSAVKLLYRFSHLHTLVVRGEGNYCLLHLSGAATFLRLPQLAKALDRLPVASEVHIDLTELDHIDHACLELLMTWTQQHERSGGTLIVDWGSLHAAIDTTAEAEEQRQSTLATAQTAESRQAAA